MNENPYEISNEELTVDEYIQYLEVLEDMDKTGNDTLTSGGFYAATQLVSARTNATVSQLYALKIGVFSELLDDVLLAIPVADEEDDG